MLNNVSIIGRLTKEVNLNKTQTGKPVCNFTVACKREFMVESGPETDFINCVAWNNIAQNIQKYCQKGDLVAVKGRIQTRKNINQYGNNYTIFEILCESIQFLSSKKAIDSNNSLEHSVNLNEMNTNIINQKTTFDINMDDIQF